MLGLLPLIAFLALFLFIGNHFANWGWRKSFLRSLLLHGSYVVLLTEVLSIFRGINRVILTVSWLVPVFFCWMDGEKNSKWWICPIAYNYNPSRLIPTHLVDFCIHCPFTYSFYFMDLASQHVGFAKIPYATSGSLGSVKIRVALRDWYRCAKWDRSFRRVRDSPHLCLVWCWSMG